MTIKSKGVKIKRQKGLPSTYRGIKLVFPTGYDDVGIYDVTEEELRDAFVDHFAIQTIDISTEQIWDIKNNHGDTAEMKFDWDTQLWEVSEIYFTN